jgi:hypothetical protein
LYNLANSILAECKQEASVADLDTAVYLLREALCHRPASHNKRSDSLSDLVLALVARFWYIGQHQDLEEAISLGRELLRLKKDGMGGVATASHDSQLLVFNLNPFTMLWLLTYDLLRKPWPTRITKQSKMKIKTSRG